MCGLRNIRKVTSLTLAHALTKPLPCRAPILDRLSVVSLPAFEPGLPWNALSLFLAVDRRVTGMGGKHIYLLIMAVVTYRLQAFGATAESTQRQ